MALVPPAGQARADTSRDRRRRTRAAAWASCAAIVLAAAPRPAVGEPPSARTESRLPELVRTKNRSFTIPFQPPRSQDPDPDAAPQRILLNVSRDMGLSWETAGEAAPGAGSFTFRAEADGEYWFRLRALDRKGRSRGGEGPDVRVLVDAAGPRLSARVWKGADGEIVCRYAAADDSLRLESLRVEYRGPEDRGWKTVAAQGILVRESPAHVVGEEIWWAGEKVEALTVQIAIADGSGNQAVKQFKLQPSDPGVDQAALAREIGLQPLPEQQAGDDDAPAVSAPDEPTGSTRAVAAGTAAGGWSAEAGDWSAEEPARAPGAGRAPAPTRPAASGAPQRSTATPVSTRPAAADPALAAAASGPEYLGKPLHLARARRFQWDYEVPAGRTATTAVRAELWTTRDGGVSWQQGAVDTDGRSPIEVELPGPGLYGVRLEVVVDAADRDGGPRSGETPDAWVGVDEEPPQVELVAVTRDDTDAAGAALLIRYAARDQLLAPRSTRLLYSPHPDGPWATIAEALENQGEHRWQPGRSVPARVFVRVESIDAAGNAGNATSAEAIATAAPRVGGKLGGLRVMPPASAP